MFSPDPEQNRTNFLHIVICQSILSHPPAWDFLPSGSGWWIYGDLLVWLVFCGRGTHDGRGAGCSVGASERGL